MRTGTISKLIRHCAQMYSLYFNVYILIMQIVPVFTPLCPTRFIESRVVQQIQIYAEDKKQYRDNYYLYISYIKQPIYDIGKHGEQQAFVWEYCKTKTIKRGDDPAVSYIHIETKKTG